MDKSFSSRGFQGSEWISLLYENAGQGSRRDLGLLKLLAAFDLNPQRMVAYDFGRGIISSSYHQFDNADHSM